MVYVVQLKVNHKSPYTDLSNLLEEEHLIFYCNDYFDLIVIDGKITEDHITKIRETLNVENPPIYNASEVGNVNYIIIECKCVSSSQVSIDIILKNLGIQISPVMYSEGWEIHHFICLDRSNVSTIIGELREHFEVEILSLLEHEYFNPLAFFGLSADRLYSMLTQNQMELLIKAHGDGYYNIPREIKLYEIAESLNRSRYSVERAIRKAEMKIMGQVIPLVDLKLKMKKLS